MCGLCVQLISVFGNQSDNVLKDVSCQYGVCMCEGRGCTAQTAEGYPLPQFSLNLDSINWANNIPSAIHVLSQRKVFQNGYKREPRTNFNTEICCMLF